MMFRDPGRLVTEISCATQWYVVEAHISELSKDIIGVAAVSRRRMTSVKYNNRFIRGEKQGLYPMIFC